MATTWQLEAAMLGARLRAIIEERQPDGSVEAGMALVRSLTEALQGVVIEAPHGTDLEGRLLWQGQLLAAAGAVRRLLVAVRGAGDVPAAGQRLGRCLAPLLAAAFAGDGLVH